jgi:hypothetical protein
VRSRSAEERLSIDLLGTHAAALAMEGRQQSTPPAAGRRLDTFPIVPAAGRDTHHDRPSSFFGRRPRVADPRAIPLRDDGERTVAVVPGRARASRQPPPGIRSGVA